MTDIVPSPPPFRDAPAKMGEIAAVTFTRKASAGFRGFSWGIAAHGALAVATEGLDADTL